MDAKNEEVRLWIYL